MFSSGAYCDYDYEEKNQKLFGKNTLKLIDLHHSFERSIP